MKVLYVITKADEIGGAQIHLRDMSKKLKDDGHTVIVVTGEDGALVKQLKGYGIEVNIITSLVRQISPLNDLKAIFKLRKFIKNVRPDILSLHSSKAGIIGRLASVLLGIPVVFTAHGWSFAEGINNNQRKLYALIEKILAPLLDKVITVSHQDKKLAIEMGVLGAEKQIVVHNGIPTLSDSSISGQMCKHEEKVRIVCVARFSEQKDHGTLLRALNLLPQVNWELVLIGKGPLMENVRNLALTLGVEDKVSFLGERNDVEEILSSSDIFVLPSNWEGLPLSILEAMRAGLPVIATDVGGVSEIITNDINGYLVPKKNIDILQNRLSQLLSSADLRSRLGENGKKTFEENFSFEEMYHKTLCVYESVISSTLKLHR